MRWVVSITIAAVLAAASMSSAMAAAKHAAKPTKAKMSGACAQQSGRCVSDCDQLNWCTMYTCVNGQSTPVPFWRCYQPSGLCLAPHC
jgi:curli biogenesis system outer membrane secretion channel CsgG